MKTILMSAALVAFTAPALADDQPAQSNERLSNLEHMVITAIKEQPQDERLNQLEHVTITAIKDEPVSRRLTELEFVTSTAKKEQPASHKVDEKTAALLAEIAKEE